MNFNNIFILFVHFSLFELTKCKKKCFMIYSLRSENLHIFQNANTTLNILETVAKTCKKVLRLNLVTKGKVEHVHSYNKTVHITI